MIAKKCYYRGTSKLVSIHHVGSEHDGVRFSCDECVYQAKRRTILKAHKEAVDENIRYNCDDFEGQSHTTRYLEMHRKRKHGGILYTGTKNCHTRTCFNLKYHVLSKHTDKGITFNCKVFDYPAISPKNLKLHTTK